MLKLGGKYDEVLDPKNNEFHCKYNMSDLVFSDYDYDNYFVPPLEDDKNVSTMLSVEEQAKEKGLKVLNPKKLLTRFTVLLIQIKTKK